MTEGTSYSENVNIAALYQAANESRGLAMDAVATCKSGHLGLPLGSADMGAGLFGHLLSYWPENPRWLNRDRFVLSAGHGSMFLYSWLHLAGYKISLEDLKKFRALHSITPGHPESAETPGVECTTGPLGQGVGNAVGMACAAKITADKYNTATHTVFDHSIVCLCGDGDLQEGVALEALTFAARHALDNLILIYDSNDVTLDSMASKTQNDNVQAKFHALGFEVHLINGHDIGHFIETFNSVKQSKSNKPKLIIAKTIIGKGIGEVEGSSKAHGENGVPFIESARAKLGLPEERFFVSEETRNFFKEHRKKLKKRYDKWQTVFRMWQTSNPGLAKELDYSINQQKSAEELMQYIPIYTSDKTIATRAAGGTVLNSLAKMLPYIISGSADLHGSTKNYIDDKKGDFDVHNLQGRNIYFGIREHGMGAIVNGFGYYGLFRPSGATFLTFSDYMRASIRVAAIAKLPIFHIFTHDSVGVGEDGPTHQPVEHVSSLRLIPNLHVVRPGDPEETAAAFAHAATRTDGPVALILSRQNLPILTAVSSQIKRLGTLKGGYIFKEEKKKLEAIIIATGSELHLAFEAAKEFDDNVRIVSMPSVELFEAQTALYQNSVLPITCKKRIVIEAGVSGLWHKYAKHVIGINSFGLSAPGDQVMKEFGISAEHLVEKVKSILEK